MNRMTTKSVFFHGLMYAWIGMGVLGWSATANAQYKHGLLGAQLGFQMTGNQGGINTAPTGSRSELGYGVGVSYLTIGAHGGYRFEDRFAVIFGAHLSFHTCGFPNDVCAQGSTPFMLTVNTDFRIFFLTDSFRPYVDIGLAYWQSIAFVNSNLSSFGPTAALGFEWFFLEELSLGLQARYGLQLVVGTKGLEPFHNLHATVVFSAYL